MKSQFKHFALSPLKTLFLESFCCNRKNINFETPVVSFTFDDVPISAYENATPILENYGGRGTFYVSLGINEGVSSFMRENEVLDLDGRGHHIGCHTWSHYNLRNGSVNGFVEDARRNSQELFNILGHKILHFSYPFGEVSLKLKNEIKQFYATSRGTRPGFNYNTVDYNLLRANPLYTEIFNEKYILRLLQKTASAKGWIIFYTHGVCNNPNGYDLTPVQLNKIVKMANGEGFKILSVLDAADLSGSSQPIKKELSKPISVRDKR